jgi:ATP-dependent Lon protease
MIRFYTKESGVRGLERQISKVCRKIARRVVEAQETDLVALQGEDLPEWLGAPRYEVRSKEVDDSVGLVKGLAVTSWGGELLNIEAATVPGKGKLILTGRLGDWLKESASAAFTYTRSRTAALGLDVNFHEKLDVHIHYPGNALKTDGPSAGIAMATALASTLTGIAVRSDTAMTGEISLRGRVLRIGGLKEKILAAHRGGITRVLIPKANSKDLEELPPHVLETIEIIEVGHMDRVLAESLVGGAVAILGDADLTEEDQTLDSVQL